MTMQCWPDGDPEIVPRAIVRRWSRCALAAAVALLMALVLLGALIVPARAQITDARCYDETGTLRLYDPACCCTSGWCGPLDDRMVSEVPGGWRVTVLPGGHAKLNPSTYFVPEDRAQLCRTAAGTPAGSLR